MKLRDYQQTAVDSLFSHLSSEETGNPVIAMPTGTGKSLVIAGFITQALKTAPNTRFVVATHVKELITQNADKLKNIWPQAPYGVNSAGLKSYDFMQPVIFAGMQSIRNKVDKLGYRNCLIIDECHLIGPSQDNSYQRIISELREKNPSLRVIGLSATPWRTKDGDLVQSGIFDSVAIDMTSIEWFEWFFDNGYLVPPIPRSTKTEMDMSSVPVLAGEYKTNTMQEVAADEVVTYKALSEMCELADDRESWLIFAAGNDHCERIAEILGSFNVSATYIHSGLSSAEREKRLAEHKKGNFRAIVSNNILTTGYDDPRIDGIGVLRPTLSPGLWVQMLGRGTRPNPAGNKENCLVLDFAGNTKRLGPINDPYIPKKRLKKGDVGEAPVKICDECGTYNHTVARYCVACGHEFSFQIKITPTASNQELIRRSIPIIESYNVTKVHYYQHVKNDVPMIRVEYVCENGLHKFNEYVCLEHKGGIQAKARAWWRRRFRGDGHTPAYVYEAFKLIEHLRVPYKINVHVNKKYPEIVEYFFHGDDNAS